MVAPIAATTSIYRKGRKFIFSVLPPSEVFLEGLIDLAAKKGLETVALINVDELYARAADGQILVSSRVATAVEDFSEVQEVGSLALKGLSRPVRTFNIVRLK
jgi:hypothetical protein